MNRPSRTVHRPSRTSVPDILRFNLIHVFLDVVRRALSLVTAGILLILPATSSSIDPPPGGPEADASQSPRSSRNEFEAVILASRNPVDPWTDSLLVGLLRIFQSAKPPISPTVEYMDWQNLNATENEARLQNYYASKFGGHTVGVVVAIDAPAVNFLTKYRAALFPTAQVVACGIQKFDTRSCPPWMTAVLEEHDAPGTFRLARQLQPNLKHLVILDDFSGIATACRNDIEAQFADELRDIPIEILRVTGTPGLLAACENLAPGSAVLLPRAQFAPSLIEELCKRSPVPVYGLLGLSEMPGIIGGSLLNSEEHGEIAASVALRLRSGTPAKDIPVATAPVPRFVVDYTEMQRRGLATANIPDGAIILHRPPSFWQQHRSIILTAAGIFALLVCTIVILTRSLSHRRTAVAESRRALSTLLTTFDSIADGVLVVDRNGRIAHYNQRFLDLWRIPREVAEQGDDSALLKVVMTDLKDSHAFTTRVLEVYANPDRVSTDILEFRDGRIFERDSRPHREGAEIVGRVWTFRDVTARHHAEEEKRRLAGQLAQAQKMEALGTLAGGIAHDFNNILTGVIGYSELAKARLPASHPSAEDLEHVLRASDRAKQLIRQILTFSRKNPIETRAVLLEPIVRDTLKLLRAVVPASIEIHAEVSPDPGPIIADPTQIHQALLNLATNAVHAMCGARNGLLKVSLTREEVDNAFSLDHPPLHPGPHVCLLVADTGHGMDPSTLGRIFEPFFTTKTGGEGTGLGLAVVHGIVQAHGGALTVESEIGEGTAFRLYFPVASQSDLEAAAPLESTPKGAGERILVVDDEAMVADVSRGFLTDLGYRVTICHTPEHAIAEFDANKESYAGVVTDLNMPHITGLELLRRLRTGRPDLPAVLCTGYIGSAGTEAEAASLGVREIISKPFTRHILGVALHRALCAKVETPPVAN